MSGNEYSYNDWRGYSELYHHGIKGQKWGVKNGPPYPLDQEVHSKVVRGSKEDFSDSKKRMHVMHHPDGWLKVFTPEMQEKYTKDHPAESISDMARIPKGTDINKVLSAINGDVMEKGFTDAGRHYNCPNCATAFDMVQRGYNVQSRPKANGSNVEDIESYFNGGKLKHVGTTQYSREVFEAYKNYEATYDHKKNPWEQSPEHDAAYEKLWKANDKFAQETEKSVMKELNSQKDGSWGIVVVGWRMDNNPSARTDCYHALNYKKENGKVKFYDTQSHSTRKNNGYSDSSWIRYDCDPREIFVMQTNNLEPSDKVGEAVISRRDK